MVTRALAFSAALCLVLATSSLAQERMGDKRVYHVIKSETFEIPDKEGHVMIVSETRGYDLGEGRNALNRVVSDLVKSNGRTFGYGTVTEKDGDLLHYSFEGKVTTVVGASGKPATSAEGTWILTGGTGKWKERDAQGSWKSAAVGPGTTLAEWEGTWGPKR